MKLGILWTWRSKNHKDEDKSAGIQIAKGNKKDHFRSFGVEKAVEQ